jgi:hypothetical protein
VFLEVENVFFDSSNKQLKTLVGCVLMALLPACSKGAAGSASADSAQAQAGDSGGAVFYLEQTGTTANMSGANEDLLTYQSMLKNCQDAHQATTPLSAQDEAKLGTANVKYWHDGNRRNALLIETFHADASASGGAAMCAFKLAHTSDLTMSNGNRTYQLDLIKRSGDVQTVPTDDSSGSSPAQSPDWNQLAQEGIHKTGDGNFAGQPCVVAKNDLENTTFCVWSGGAKAGFGVQAPEEFPKGLGGKTPVFWSKSSNGGNKFNTTSFVVGHLPDTSIFDVPRDVSVKDMGGP